MNAILYFRVSKKDGSQNVANQRPEVEGLAAARGFTVVATYEDNESAVKRRPGLEAMFAALRKGKHGPAPAVVLWSLDRLGRGVAAFDLYRELVRLNVRVASCREAWLDQEGPTRELLAMLMSWVSGFERTRLIERTKAGLQRARKEGRRLGRPRTQLPEADLKKALALKAEGWGSRRIVGQLGTRCAASTLDLLLAPYASSPKKGHANRVSKAAETTDLP
jgi:putative DNA-invertase from lambdoid prophage Rac